MLIALPSYQWGKSITSELSNPLSIWSCLSHLCVFHIIWGFHPKFHWGGPHFHLLSIVETFSFEDVFFFVGIFKALIQANPMHKRFWKSYEEGEGGRGRADNNQSSFHPPHSTLHLGPSHQYKIVSTFHLFLISCQIQQEINRQLQLKRKEYFSHF